MKPLFCVLAVGILALATMPLFADGLKCHVFELTKNISIPEDPKHDVCFPNATHCVQIKGKDDDNKTFLLEACNTSPSIAAHQFKPEDICDGRNHYSVKGLRIDCCSTDLCNSAALTKLALGVFFIAFLNFLL